MNADRIALGMILGGVAAVAITKVGLTPQSATLRWIVYCVVAGLAINTQEGMKFRYLLLAGMASALCLLAALLWMLLIGHGVIPWLSIGPIDANRSPKFTIIVLTLLAIVTTGGVSVCALARPAMIDLLQQVKNIDVRTLRHFESILRVLLVIAGTVAIFLL